jgi:hypothetical protein
MYKFCCTIVVLGSMNFSAMALGFGVGPAGGGGRTAATAEAVFHPFEAWVPNAKVGDFIVVRYPSGNPQRKEVIEINDKEVVVALSEVNGKLQFKRKYSRDKSTAVEGPVELEMKKTSTAPMTIKDKKISCDLWDGYCSHFRAGYKNVTTYKGLRYQKVVCEDVPFGGVVKELIAKDDGKPIQTNTRKTTIVKNTIDTLDLIYEVTDFGNTQQKK